MLSLRLPTCLSFCVAPLLGPGNQLLGGQESLPYGKDLIAASATKVGEIGNYLQCVRMVNETYDRAGSHSRPGLKAAARAANHACIQASVQAMRPHSTLSCVSFCWDRNTLSDADLMRAFEPTTLRWFHREAVGQYALVKFEIPGFGGQQGVATSYGACVPAHCSAEELEDGFKEDLPVALESAAEQTFLLERELSALSRVTASLGATNRSFSEASRLLYNASIEANASGMPDLASAAAAAATIAADAAKADAALRSAAVSAREAGFVNASITLFGLDARLLHGPGQGWRHSLEALAQQLQMQVAETESARSTLATLTGLVVESNFHITLGAQTSAVGSVGVFTIALLCLSAVLALVATFSGSASRVGRVGGRFRALLAGESRLKASHPLIHPLWAGGHTSSGGGYTTSEAARAHEAMGERERAGVGEPAAGRVRERQAGWAPRGGGSLSPVLEAAASGNPEVVVGATATTATAPHSDGSEVAREAGAAECGLAGTAEADLAAGTEHGHLAGNHAARRDAEADGGRSAREFPGLLASFSLVRNWKSLGSLREDKTMDSLDGMRVASLAWVIFGHTAVYALGVGGTQFVAELMPDGFVEMLPPGSHVLRPRDGGRLTRWTYQLLPAAFFAVDTFFWMGGLLAAVSLAKQIRTLQASWWRVYPVYIFGRWLRLTPLVALATLWTIGLGKSVGDGPFWASQADAESCKKAWWVNILYVQNLVSYADPNYPSCLGHLWYLSNDFQFAIVAPFLAFPMVLRPKRGWCLWASALLASTIINFAMSYGGKYTASPLFDMRYFRDIYIQPWTRSQPYLVGLGLGIAWDSKASILDYLKTCTARAKVAMASASPEGSEANPPHVRSGFWSAVWPWVLMTLAAVMMLADVFGTHGLYQRIPTGWSRMENAVYISLSRLAWALGLSAIAICCFCEQAPVINGILSWSPLQSLGKLCYAAYIFHPVIMNLVNYSRPERIEFSDAWYAMAFTAYLVWAFGVALVVWMLVEKPTANMLAIVLAKLGLGRPNRK